MKAKKSTSNTAKLGKQILLSLLVITLTTVIAKAADPSSISQNQAAAAAVVAQATHKSPAQVDVAPKEAPKEIEQPKAAVPVAPIASASLESRKETSVEVPKGAAEQVSVKAEDGDKLKEAAESESSKRKARAEPTASTSGGSASTSAPAEATKTAEAAKPSEKISKPESKSSTPKTKNQPAKSAPKSKLQANLGTVTSTGSGGHYLSKHDAYSAIAEKHGALAQDAMKKSDKKQLQGFGGIQKASGGLGDVLSPFKGVTDSGLARTLGASMRSIMKSKYSVPAYVASALLGAVALMAFYESPISPLPVPALPEPPIGRFPPEMPNLPVGTQVPFRMNQQGQQGQQQYGQNYNQRSLNTLPNGQQGYYNQQPQAQQVLFPGNSDQQNAAAAQQRQMTAGGPVGQIAANLLSGKQVAQRKSGPDYDMSSSRSLFGSSPANKASGNIANHQKQPTSFLSYFGLGGSSGSGVDSLPAASEHSHQQVASINSQQAALSSAANTAANAAATALDAKSNTGLSNSHLINKVKSLFTRAAPPSSSSSGSSISHSVNSNPYEQYQRMSFVQALMKDTAFIPGFLTPSRKSSSASTGSSHSSASNRLQNSLTNALSASGNNPAARMQVGGEGTLVSNAQAQHSAVKSPANKPAGSGHLGLARAADRIAHALLETFSSGISQRNVAPASISHNQADSASRKSSNDESSQSSLASATSLLSDIMSSYSAIAPEQQQQQQQQVSQEPAARSASQSQQVQPNQQQQHVQQQQQPQSDSQQASARSLEVAQSGSHEEEHKQVAPKSSSASSSTGTSSSAPANEGHSRKTRSIGYEYPVESQQELIKREQQPSKAAQINNVIDFVADSYTQNRLLFNFVMNQVGLSQAVPYVEQILGEEHH